MLNQKPPLGRQLNRACPLARGLAGCWLLNEEAGNVVWDASGNGAVGTFGTSTASPTWVQSPHGQAVSFDGGDNISGTQSRLVAASPFTIAFFIKWTFASAKVLLEINDAANTQVCQITSYTNGAYSSIQIQQNSGTYRSYFDGATIWDSWHSLIFTHAGETAYSKLYIDGNLQTRLGAAVEFGTRSGAGQWILCQRLATAGYGSTASLSHMMWFSRALSPAEICSLYLDPYQMFQRSPIELWTAGAGGGGEAGLSVPVAAHYLNQMRRAS